MKKQDEWYMKEIKDLRLSKNLNTELLILIIGLFETDNVELTFVFYSQKVEKIDSSIALWQAAFH